MLSRAVLYTEYLAAVNICAYGKTHYAWFRTNDREGVKPRSREGRYGGTVPYCTFYRASACLPPLLLSATCYTLFMLIMT